MDLAQKKNPRMDKLESIRGLEPAMIRRYGDSWLQLLKSAGGLPKEQWPSDDFKAGQLSPEQEAMSDLLHCALRLLAAANNMSAAAIAGRKQLQALIQGERDLALMRGWRKTVAGDPLLDLLNGRRQVVSENGSLVLTQPS